MTDQNTQGFQPTDGEISTMLVGGCLFSAIAFGVAWTIIPFLIGFWGTVQVSIGMAIVAGIVGFLGTLRNIVKRRRNERKSP